MSSSKLFYCNAIARTSLPKLFDYNMITRMLLLKLPNYNATAHMPSLKFHDNNIASTNGWKSANNFLAHENVINLST
jgi:hypothetical protein